MFNKLKDIGNSIKPKHGANAALAGIGLSLIFMVSSDNTAVKVGSLLSLAPLAAIGNRYNQDDQAERSDFNAVI